MRQQINLYQPIFRAERKLFSAVTVAIVCGVLVLAYIAIWAFGAVKVARLATEVELLQGRARVQEAMIGTTAGLRAQRANPAALQAQIDMLGQELGKRTRALEVLRSGAVGEPQGFAARLEALARGHLHGVWLDHLVLAGASGTRGDLRLEGSAMHADLVPRYLQRLASETELSGVRFAQFAIERPKDEEQSASAASIRFRASSAALLEQERVE